VKGLLSSEGGDTFNEWLNYLGGKSVNGSGVLFAFQDSVPYHIYWKVLNAKDYGVPQNRERVFIIGIRDDQDNNFTFPPEEPLTKRLKDVLEAEVEEKYYLSEKMLAGLKCDKHLTPDRINNSLRCGGGSSIDKKHSFDLVKVGFINQDTQASQVYDSGGLSPNLCAGTHGYANGYIEEPKICAMRGRNIENPKSRKSGLPTQQMIEVNENGVSNSLTTVQKDNLVVEPYIIDNTMGFNENPIIYDKYSPCLRAGRHGLETISQSRIRKLTPIECFRLMDFPDSLVENARKAGVSDSQLYKQAGNSIVVAVLEKIINRLKL
jgi:DNA (cytosine-5)-methyltransferase 1